MAQKYGITVYIGDGWQRCFVWKDKATLLPHNLTGWTATLDIFSATGTILKTLTSAGGELVITPAEGLVLAKMDDSVTALLTAQTGSYKLHLDHTSTSWRERLFYGTALIVG